MNQACPHTDAAATGEAASELRPIKIWPRQDSSRIPLWVYMDQHNYRSVLEASC